MHIKQVIVEGFKTYKTLTALDPFDARHNVIGECVQHCEIEAGVLILLCLIF
jgi:hypothetical protein